MENSVNYDDNQKYDDFVKTFIKKEYSPQVELDTVFHKYRIVLLVIFALGIPMASLMEFIPSLAENLPVLISYLLGSGLVAVGTNNFMVKRMDKIAAKYAEKEFKIKYPDFDLSIDQEKIEELTKKYETGDNVELDIKKELKLEMTGEEKINFLESQKKIFITGESIEEKPKKLIKRK